MSTTPTPPKEALDRLVEGVVDAVHPRRIVLFGSAARGQMGPHSDLDLLVVMPNGTHRRETAMRLYGDVRGIGWGVDYLVVTEDDIEKYGTEPSMAICPALEEGRELYRAT